MENAKEEFLSEKKDDIEEHGPKRGCYAFFKMYWKTILTILWPLIGLPLIVGKWARGEKGAKFRCLYIVFIMSGYWISNCVSPFATGAIPLFSFPLFNIVPIEYVGMSYIKEISLIYFSTMLIAFCVENSGLHRRIALFIIRYISHNIKIVHFLITLITMLLSFTLPDTVAVILMCPIVKGLLGELERIDMFTDEMIKEEHDIDADDRLMSTADIQTTLSTVSLSITRSLTKRYNYKSLGILRNIHDRHAPIYQEYEPNDIEKCFYLGIAYSGTIGSLCTVKRTGIIIKYKRYTEKLYSEKYNKKLWRNWLLYSSPISLILFLVTWIWLEIIYMKKIRLKHKKYKKISKNNAKNIKAAIILDYNSMTRIKWYEIWSLILWLATVVFYFITVNQYSSHTVEILLFLLIIIYLLFIIPTNNNFIYSCDRDEALRPNQASPTLMSWQHIVNQFQWGALMLIGSLFTIATASDFTNLSPAIAKTVVDSPSDSPMLASFKTMFTASFLAECISTCVSFHIFVKFIVDNASKLNNNTILMGHSAVIGSCCSFLTPNANPSNTVIADYANINSHDMIKAGLVLKMLFLILHFAALKCYGPVFWNLS